MDYIDKLRIKAFMYRLCCGLRIDKVQNQTKLNLSADDLYTRRLTFYPDGFDFLIVPLEYPVDIDKPSNAIMIGYENNKLTIKGWTQ